MSLNDRYLHEGHPDEFSSGVAEQVRPTTQADVIPASRLATELAHFRRAQQGELVVHIWTGESGQVVSQYFAEPDQPVDPDLYTTGGEEDDQNIEYAGVMDDTQIEMRITGLTEFIRQERELLDLAR